MFNSQPSIHPSSIIPKFSFSFIHLLPIIGQSAHLAPSSPRGNTCSCAAEKRVEFCSTFQVSRLTIIFSFLTRTCNATLKPAAVLYGTYSAGPLHGSVFVCTKMPPAPLTAGVRPRRLMPNAGTRAADLPHQPPPAPPANPRAHDPPPPSNHHHPTNTHPPTSVFWSGGRCQ